jgi:hypothetical protein
MSKIVWHELRSLDRELFRYDLCGEQADTVHLVPWCGHDCEHALFGCDSHDAGGYWFRLDDWLARRDEFERHLEQKIDLDRCDADHPGGLYVLMRRVNELTRPVVERAVRVHVPPRFDDRVSAGRRAR